MIYCFHDKESENHMKQLNKLNLKVLESRMTKTSTTKEALSIVTPFTVNLSPKNTKIKVYRGNL